MRLSCPQSPLFLVAQDERQAGSPLTRHSFPTWIWKVNLTLCLGAEEIWAEAKWSCMNLEAHTYYKHWGRAESADTYNPHSEAQWAEIRLCSARPWWNLYSKLLGAPGKLPSSPTPTRATQTFLRQLCFCWGLWLK